MFLLLLFLLQNGIQSLFQARESSGVRTPQAHTDLEIDERNWTVVLQVSDNSGIKNTKFERAVPLGLFADSTG